MEQFAVQLMIFLIFLATHWLDFIAANVVGAVYGYEYRFRGGGNRIKGLGTQGARTLFWALPVALPWAVLCYLGQVPAPLWSVVPVFLAALVGLVAFPHGVGQDLGRKDGTLVNDLGYLNEAGITRLYLLALSVCLWLPAALLLPLGGMLHSVACYVGAKLDDRGWRLPRVAFFTEWGELLWGYTQGVMFYVLVRSGVTWAEVINFFNLGA